MSMYFYANDLEITIYTLFKKMFMQADIGKTNNVKYGIRN